MSFFISDAMAEGAAAPQGGGMQLIIMMAIFFGIMYFMIIRPQMKRQKEHKQLMASLDKGSEIVTAGGVAGRIRQVGENFLVVEIAKDVEIRIQKSSVTSVVPKGTIDSL